MSYPWPYTLKGNCLSQVQLHKRLWKSTFILSEMKRFDAGQYFSFYTNDRTLVGYFSIASAPEDLPFIWLYTRAPLHCKIGEELWLSSPQGLMTIDKEALTHYVFYAGGTGITPFLSIARAHEAYPHWQIHWSIIDSQDEVMLENFPMQQRSRLQISVSSRKNDFNIAQTLKPSLSADKQKYFLAGPLGYVEKIGQELLEAQVSSTSIFSDLKKFH